MFHTADQRYVFVLNLRTHSTLVYNYAKTSKALFPCSTNIYNIIQGTRDKWSTAATTSHF